MAAFTDNLLLPVRSPMLPVVEVIVKIPVANAPVKLPEVTSFWAARVIELEPLSAAAKEKPPLVLVSVMSCAVIVAPAIELTVPSDVTSNTVPAADGKMKFVELALFTKTVPVPPVNSDTSGASIWTRAALDVPMLPVSEVSETRFEESAMVDDMFPEPSASSRMEFVPFSAAVTVMPPLEALLVVIKMSLAVTGLLTVIARLVSKSKVLPAEDVCNVIGVAVTLLTKADPSGPPPVCTLRVPAAVLMRLLVPVPMKPVPDVRLTVGAVIVPPVCAMSPLPNEFRVTELVPVTFCASVMSPDAAVVTRDTSTP